MIYFQSYIRRLLTLLLIFVVGASITMVVAAVWSSSDRVGLLLSSAVQNLLMFGLPALAAPVFFCTKPMSFVGVNNAVRFRQICGIVLLFILVIPSMDQLIYYNEHINLPQQIREVADSLEQQALAATNTILDVNSVGGLIVNLLVVGALTGVCEELFFRAGVQRTLMSSKRINPHLAIWVAAFIFSAMHFQFYGFVPRLFLGAIFGYLYYWTGSIWVSATAHSLNNSIVVVTVWLQLRGYLPSDFNTDSLGVTHDSFPWLPLFSAVVTILIMVLAHRYFFGNGKQQKSI